MLIKPFSYLQQKVAGGPPSGPPNIDQTNLLVWYDANFPGNSPSTTWEDLTGNGYNMTVTSAGTGTNPTLTTTTDEAYYQLTGVYNNPGSSANQTGGGYFTQAINPLGATFDCTITIWLYPDLNYSLSTTAGRWVSAGTSGPTGRLFYGSGFGLTNFGIGSGYTVNPSPMIHPTQSTWQEFTVTFENGVVTGGIAFYKDGSQYATANAGTRSIASGAPLHIGKQYDALAEYFSGRIAMVFIYNRALNSTEVLSNYNAVTARYNY